MENTQGEKARTRRDLVENSRRDSDNSNNSNNSNNSSHWRSSIQIDAGIIIVVVLMLAFGLVMLFSASMSESITEGSSSTSYLVRQTAASLIGVGVMYILSRFNLKVFDKPIFAVIAYLVSLILLILTLFTDPINGARRWLSIPGFGTFQPSELTKVVTVYTIAVYESWLFKERASGKYARKTGLSGAIQDALLDIVVPVGFTLVPIAVMSMQTHMSGIIIILLVAFATLLAAGLPLRSWLVAAVIGLAVIAVGAAGIAAAWPILPDSITGRFGHVFTRLNIFMGDSSVTETDLYQSNQAFIAIGSGGLTGVGLGQGRQKNNYLPEVHNDYIFSSIVEETGFIGGLFVIIIFAAFFILGMRVAYKSSSVYAQIVATGISTLITLQAILNVAVNVGIVPPTGISLPFFSYGGTSNLFFLIGVGLLLNVSKYGVRNSQ